MKPTISSISTVLEESSKKNLGNGKSKVVNNESDYLLTTKPTDLSKLAAEGIQILFSLFAYNVHTLQFIRTNPDGTTNAPARSYSDPKLALKDACKHSNEGYDIFFMVNEGDGIVHTNKRVCRSQANVINLSKCFIDTDNCPIDKVHKYLDSIGLKPHLKVESSPGRYHLYFSFYPVEKTEETLEQWRAIQHIIHRLGDATIHSPAKTLGTDGTMHDYSKVLRVPGFTHIKKQHVVKVVEQNDLPPYTLDELFTLTNAQSFLDHSASGNGNDLTPSIPDLTSETIYDAGERYAALQSLTMYLANQTDISRDAHFVTFSNFVRSRLDNTDNVYCNPDGTLTPKSLALFDSAFKKIEREVIENVTLITTSDPDKQPADPWHLPDSFYLSAPNGFGDVVKQVMDKSLYPCAALAFGTFITGLSILRAKTTLTPGGSAPTIYTINVAISGYGKSDPMTMLQNTFHSLGLGSLIENEIRSDRGIYEHMEINHGFGFFLIDEVAALLRAIQKKEASPHHANISAALLRLYSSSAMKGVSFGRVAKSKTKTDKPIILDNPMIAVCAFTTTSEFSTLFNADAIEKGMVQRFIPIVPEIIEIPENPAADKHAIVKSDLFSVFVEAQELDDEGSPVPSLTNTQRTKSIFSPAAQTRFTEVSRHYRHLMITAAKDPELSQTSGLYSRVSEQIERIATILSQDEISLTALDYAITFMESRHKALMATAENTILRGKGSESIKIGERVLACISRICQEQNLSIISQRELFHRVKKNYESMGEFKKHLNDLEQQGKIDLPKFKKGTRTIDGVKLSDVL